MTATGRVDAHAHQHDAFAVSVRFYAGLLDRPAPTWRIDGDRLVITVPGEEVACDAPR